jgi:hypothetical protein
VLPPVTSCEIVKRHLMNYESEVLERKTRTGDDQTTSASKHYAGKLHEG